MTGMFRIGDVAQFSPDNIDLLFIQQLYTTEEAIFFEEINLLIT